jgi:CBS domain-containing protein
MLCTAIMNARPVTLSENVSVGEAAETLMRSGETSLPVIAKGGRFIGMFGTEECLCLLAPRVALAGRLTPNLRFVEDDEKVLTARFDGTRGRPVQDFVDRNTAVLRPDSPLSDAFRLLCRNSVPVAVVESRTGVLRGMLSRHMLLNALTGVAALEQS